MLVLCINLERAASRRREMCRRFDHLGVQATFESAVDGDALTPADLALVDRRGRARLRHRPLTASCIGCWLSHRRIWERLAADGPEIAAVLEDDGILDGAFPAALAATAQSPHPFDILFLHRHRTDREFIPLMVTGSGHRIGRVRFNDAGASAYLITRSAAARLLSATPRLLDEVDREMHAYWRSGLQVLYLDPPVVSHDFRARSQIGEARSAAKRGPGAFSVRRAFRRSRQAVGEAIVRRRAFGELRRGDARRDWLNFNR